MKKNLSEIMRNGATALCTAGFLVCGTSVLLTGCNDNKSHAPAATPSPVNFNNCNDAPCIDRNIKMMAPVNAQQAYPQMAGQRKGTSYAKQQAASPSGPSVTPMDPSIVAPIFAQLINDLENKDDADVAVDLNNICTNQDEIESFFAGLDSDQQNALDSELSGGRLDSIVNTMTPDNKSVWLQYYSDLRMKGLQASVTGI